MARLLHDLLRPRAGVACARLAGAALALAPCPVGPGAQPADPPLPEGAAEGKALGEALRVDPKTLFDLDQDGATVILEGGGEIPLEQLFPGEGAVDTGALREAYGQHGAVLDLGHEAQATLDGQASVAGEAYRSVLASPWQDQRDLSGEPFWQATRDLLGDVDRLGSSLGRCVPTTTIGTGPRHVHRPDPRVCTRPPATAVEGACRIERSIAIGDEQATARLAAYGRDLNSFRLDFAQGRWASIAPSDGTRFAGEVPRLDRARLCDGALAAALELRGTLGWGDAPVPGVIDGTADVRVLQQPSCGNGLIATVRLDDNDQEPGSTLELKYAAELALHIRTLEDAWFPRGCLELVTGGTLDPACTLQVTPIAAPDAAGCAIHDGHPICRGDAVWTALGPPPFDPGETRIDRLASGADVRWSCPTGTAAPNPVVDGCAGLRDRPECRFVASTCIEGAVDAQGNCTAYEDRYDCGRDVLVDDGSPRTRLQCDGAIRCLGDSCTGGADETNPSFAEAAAALKGADLTALDGACHPETGACAIFTGQGMSCKKVLAGTVDCCQDVQGVSLASYLELAFAVTALDGAMATLDPTSPLRGGWEAMASPVSYSWDWIGGSFTSALNGVTGSTAPAAGSAEALGLLAGARQALTRQTAQWTLDTFGPAAANALFTVNGGAAVAADGTLAAGTAQLGGYAAIAGTALTWIGVAYTSYQAALILAQIVWQCDQDELELAVKRELGMCTALGSFCSTKTPAGCLVARRSYCCFASPLSRILQEQLRPQLGVDFGEPEEPDCRGIPFQEVQAIDWSKVDLSEWLAILAENGQLPDAEAITAERLTGSLRSIARTPGR